MQMGRLIRPISLILGVSACLFLSLPAQAKVVGHVTQVSGHAWVLHGGYRAALIRGQALHQSDTVITSEDATARLKMQDGSRIYIAPSSRLGLSRYGRQKHAFSALLNMFWGKVRFAVNKLASRGAMFSVRTTTAVIGVRGTEFVVESPMPATAKALAFKAGLSLNDLPKVPTSVSLFSGVVALTSASGIQQIMSPGQRANVSVSGDVLVQNLSGAGGSQGAQGKNARSAAKTQASGKGSGGQNAQGAGGQNVGGGGNIQGGQAGPGPQIPVNINNAGVSAGGTSGVTQGVTITTPPGYHFGGR